MSHSAHSDDHVHAVPLRILFAVFAALIILTFLTVGVTKVDLGGLNIWIALGVAVAKAILVALYFMHLRWDSPYNSLILAVAFVFVGIFIGFALKDSLEYQKYVERPALLDRLQPQTIQDIPKLPDSSESDPAH
ncbi:hypothetical protein KS4_31220 [Poriferisphaera corsica]|uniref:Caa(3)-type oxidase subunit IV n=1 Tax=Poriferisphaera corsica TaxID=2528020 RepID=A0A517YXU6_9BACT|nr:cytochrome C oxidase subunit IV family protein [Poriferisphaera corsica]QDU35045.1 hypothetical protein KS4_31220 [Poriferisphaera corsica]